MTSRRSDIPGVCPIGRSFCSWTCEHYDSQGGHVGPFSWPACMYRRESDPCPLVRAGVEGAGDCDGCQWDRRPWRLTPGGTVRDLRKPWPDRCALAADPSMDERIAAIREVE